MDKLDRQNLRRAQEVSLKHRTGGRRPSLNKTTPEQSQLQGRAAGGSVGKFDSDAEGDSGGDYSVFQSGRQTSKHIVEDWEA